MSGVPSGRRSIRAAGGSERCAGSMMTRQAAKGTAHVEAVAQDHASAEEADAGDDVRGDLGGVRAAVHVRVEHEQRRPGGDQGVRPQPGPPGPPLAFDADQRAAAEADGEAQ